MHSDVLARRMGLFAELASKSNRRFGRTALMKLCYFLQEVKDIPLEYHFSLYSYGPFDSDVLADLQTAEELKILDAEIERYPGGYGYQISAGPNSDKAVKYAEDFLSEYQDEIDWAAQSLAGRAVSDLELASTIVFVAKERTNASDDSLIPLVRAIKPQFSIADVRRQIEWLRASGLFDFHHTQ